MSQPQGDIAMPPPQEAKEETETASTVLVSRPQSPNSPDSDIKKCWICFSDETEDTPESSAWRDPCPCALVAHEDCLLDWIADMESPTSRKRTLGPPHIACPQCKSDIHLVRPRNALVEIVRAMERAAAKAVIPAALATGFWTLVHACETHGMWTIFTVFGPADAQRILAPRLDFVDLHTGAFLDRVTRFLVHWRLRVGLPLITPLLVLSRTSIADSVLPVLPIVFFATQGESNTPLDISWPPSASATVAVLPYIRSAYNAYYNHVWAEKEKKWLKNIQPRSGREDTGDANAAQQQQDAVDAEENNFEIRIDGGIWDDWGGEEQIAEVEMEVAPPLDAPPRDDDDDGAPQQQQQQQQRQQAAQQQQQQGNQERLLSFSTTAIAENVLGALMFPTIASLSGEALKYLLPKTWTTGAAAVGLGRVGGGGRATATGLLQEKWGRSIVGGCLFVVVKDAVMLYVRWKMAQQHRRRHVLDYDRKAKKYR